MTLTQDPVRGTDALRARVLAEIDARRSDLVQLSHSLHERPETAYKEYMASELLAEYLHSAGFEVTRSYCGIETAYRADARTATGDTVVGILAEYDALPEIGHGCGHNLIAMMGTAAAVGLRSVMDDLAGGLAAIGTPAEEGGGGKVALLRAGGFDDIDIAMMVHPRSKTMATRATLAANRVQVEFFGRAAHAAAQPHEGISALEGVLQLFNAVNGLRLMLRPDARVHGIISAGGVAANVIPDYAAAKFSVRALDRRYQQEVLRRFIACAEGAARATGTEVKVTIEENAGYENLVASSPIAERWRTHLQTLGRQVEEPTSNDGLGSTDMGNVSQVIPAVQPYIAIGPSSLPYHSVEFRDRARTAEAHDAALDAAKAMALTGLDLLREPALLRAAREEFAARRERGEVKGRR